MNNKLESKLMLLTFGSIMRKNVFKNIKLIEQFEYFTLITYKFNLRSFPKQCHR